MVACINRDPRDILQRRPTFLLFARPKILWSQACTGTFARIDAFRAQRGEKGKSGSEDFRFINRSK